MKRQNQVKGFFEKSLLIWQSISSDLFAKEAIHKTVYKVYPMVTQQHFNQAL